MSRNIKRRWNEHKSYLNNHTHANQYLQSAWIKYGETNFNFYVLELCEEKILAKENVIILNYTNLCRIKMDII